MPYTAGFSVVEVTVQQPSRLLCSCPFDTELDPSLPLRPQLQHCSSDTLRYCASAAGKFDSRDFSSWPSRDKNLDLVDTLNFCAGFYLRKAVSVCNALYSTIHGYANVYTTFCMDTAAIVRHTVQLSTSTPLYSAVGVCTELFSAVQALGRLPTAASSCAALPRCCYKGRCCILFCSICHDGYCPMQFGLQLAEMLSIILVAQMLSLH